MEIFIGNLPDDTSTVDLRRLLGVTGEKTRYRINRKKLLDGTTKCYGQAVVEADDKGEELIDSLNHTVLQNCSLEVREFFERSHVHDRRAPLWSGTPWMGLDRRKLDRRGK